MEDFVESENTQQNQSVWLAGLSQHPTYLSEPGSEEGNLRY